MFCNGGNFVEIFCSVDVADVVIYTHCIMGRKQFYDVVFFHGFTDFQEIMDYDLPEYPRYILVFYPIIDNLKLKVLSYALRLLSQKQIAQFDCSLLKCVVMFSVSNFESRK